jgi:hypothetical protein
MTIEISLPILHPGQVEIYRNRAKLNVVRCGRRWGKTKQMVTMAADAAIKGRKVGLFTPEHKQLQEPYEELLSILRPIKQRASKTEGTIRTVTSGVIDFWYLDDNELAGRGREYDLVMGDEAAFTKDGQAKGIWERSIKPTMLTRPKSAAWFFSTPNGNDTGNFFWQLCNDQEMGFFEHYAPTSTNPFVPPEELEREREKNHPLVFQQEYLAQFVDWSGVAFFALDKLLVDGEGVDYPAGCDTVFFVADTAVKGGAEHDGTAVSWWAFSSFGPHPLVCLDWDMQQIDSALLENIVPQWVERGHNLARQCRARFGFTGGNIEDVSAGSMLLQQCALRGLPVYPLPSDLTAAGKDNRAINASGPVYRGEVKFSRVVADKNDVTFKGATRNHFLSQITGFRIGDKNAAKRADDCLDTFTYAIAITLGNSKGYA